MEITTLIITALVAAIPLKVIEEAYRKKIAKEEGLKPNSIEAFQREAKEILKKFLALALIGLPIYGWFLSQSTHDYGKWLEGARGFLTDVARFVPKLLAALGLITLSVLFLWVLAILLTDGKSSKVSRAIWKRAKKCLIWCLHLFIATVLFIELACVAGGGNVVIASFKAITIADCAEYAYIATVFGSVLGTGLMAYQFVVSVMASAKTLKKTIKRRKAAATAKKVK